MVEGARRIGKSTICEEFGKKEYKSYILIDFAKKDKEIEMYFNYLSYFIYFPFHPLRKIAINSSL